jgi:hypothetical protein
MDLLEGGPLEEARRGSISEFFPELSLSLYN